VGANGGFSDAFDAAPTADGSTIFFTGVDANHNAGVFKQDLCTSGSTTSVVYTGSAFDAPFGIALSTDDSTIFVADPSAAQDPTFANPLQDKGCLYKLPASGGVAPTILVGSVAPRSVTVNNEAGADQVYFTGIDGTNGLPGVFKTPAAGSGAVTVVAEGSPFVDPAGIAVAANGDVYVVDTIASSANGVIIRVPQGTTTGAAFVSNIQVGYPAGIGILDDGSQLLVSSLGLYAASDILLQVEVASMALGNNTTGVAVAGYSEAAGLHRAAHANVFAWADTKATPTGMTGVGTVFVIQ